MSKQMSCEAWSCLPKLEENGENNMSLPQPEQQYQAQHISMDFVLPFSALHRDMLALVGGKAANLGELTNAKFPVPPGFCVTTTAYALVAADAGLQSVLDTHATSQAGEGGDAQRLTDMAQAARHCILAATIPTEIADAITGAYGVLGSGEPIPVAVRSSAPAQHLLVSRAPLYEAEFRDCVDVLQRSDVEERVDLQLAAGARVWYGTVYIQVMRLH